MPHCPLAWILRQIQTRTLCADTDWSNEFRHGASENFHRSLEATGPRMATVDADEVLEALPGGKHRPWRDADLVGEGTFVQLQRGDLLGQLDPEDKAAA